MRLANRIVVATLNHDKFREFQDLFKSYPELELSPMGEYLRNGHKLSLVEVHDTYLENVFAKARVANQGCHYPILADDSGLEVDALEGRPGVKSHRYAKLPLAATASREAQDHANRELLLKELKAKGNVSRSARFVTALALIIDGILIYSVQTLPGEIAENPRGTHGFGYDSLFIPSGSNKTLAEMTDAEKNSISHRAKAVHDLMAQIKARGIVFAKP